MQMGGYLFRSTAPTTTIAAAGTSCRHQILMERRNAEHPVTILKIY
jgi:hypothetical protein